MAATTVADTKRPISTSNVKVINLLYCYSVTKLFCLIKIQNNTKIKRWPCLSTYVHNDCRVQTHLSDNLQLQRQWFDKSSKICIPIRLERWMNTPHAIYFSCCVLFWFQAYINALWKHTQHNTWHASCDVERIYYKFNGSKKWWPVCMCVCVSVGPAQIIIIICWQKNLFRWKSQRI